MTSDPAAIRRMLDDAVPIPPWIVRSLVEEAERSRHNMAYAFGALQMCDTQRLALLDAARAWDDAIEYCDGIVAAEQVLRSVLRELGS
jgi:hypothetical protein